MSEREPVRSTWAAESGWGSERAGTPETGGPTMAQASTVPSAPGATTPTWAGRQRGGDGRELVPRERPTSYYGRPIIKPPPWNSPLIASYFFFGGLAGGSAALGAAAHVARNPRLERSAWAASLAGIAVSPPLLIADLGRPARFLNMLRVFKVTSPMSVGSWVLSATGGAVAAAAAASFSPRVPRWVGSAAAFPAGALGTLLASYTGGLLANTSVPAWHEARRELPFVFAGSAMASAGAAALALTPPEHAAPARRLLIAGAAVETVAGRAMEHRLGELAQPYRTGTSGRLTRAALVATMAGATVAVAAGGRRAGAAVAATLTLAGSALERFAVFEAGLASAGDPAATTVPQRRRLEARGGQRERSGEGVAGSQRGAAKP
jgi:formate-dependent nitrite reductase membrane component NrfD